MKSYIFVFLIGLSLIGATGCSNIDPSTEKLLWLIWGFPLLGLAYAIGTAVSGKSKNRSEEPVVKYIVIGAIILLVIYGIFKAVTGKM